jgi:hypothetical protein
MHKKDFVVIAIRLFALYFIVIAVESIAINLSFFTATDQTSRPFIFSSILVLITKFLVGIILWLFSTSLANIVMKNLSKDTSILKGFTLDSFQKVAISLIGIIVLSSAIPELFEIIFSYIFPETSSKYMRSLGMLGKMKADIPVVDLVKLAVKIVLGVWLLLGPKGIVGAVKVFWAKGKSI